MDIIKLLKIMDLIPTTMINKLELIFPKIKKAKLMREWYKINPNSKFGWISFSLFPYQFKHKIDLYSYGPIIELIVSGKKEIYDDHYVQIGKFCSIAGDIVF